MYLMRTGLDWLASQLGDAAGELVTIRRGARTLPDVTAVRKTDRETLVDADGFKTSVCDLTWLLPIDLGDFVEPRGGDQITDADGTTWEVLPTKSAPSVENWGYGQMWTVRTKRVKRRGTQ